MTTVSSQNPQCSSGRRDKSQGRRVQDREGSDVSCLTSSSVFHSLRLVYSLELQDKLQTFEETIAPNLERMMSDMIQ